MWRKHYFIVLVDLIHWNNHLSEADQPEDTRWTECSWKDQSNETRLLPVPFKKWLLWPWSRGIRSWPISTCHLLLLCLLNPIASHKCKSPLVNSNMLQARHFVWWSEMENVVFHALPHSNRFNSEVLNRINARFLFYSDIFLHVFYLLLGKWWTPHKVLRSIGYFPLQCERGFEGKTPTSWYQLKPLLQEFFAWWIPKFRQQLEAKALSRNHQDKSIILISKYALLTSGPASS